MEINPFKAVYPNFNFIASSDYFVKNAKQEYNSFKQANFFLKNNNTALYAYRIKTDNSSHIGLIGCASMEDYLNENIKKHENILAAKEQQQLQLMIKRGAAVKPVLLTYPNVSSIDKIIEKTVKEEKIFYEVSIGEGKELHTFWEIKKKKDIADIQKAFKSNVPCSYIADGHHRSASTVAMANRMKAEGKKGNFGQILAAFFPVNQLSIYDYNRVVDGIRERSTAQLIVQLSQIFNIKMLKEAKKPSQKHQITMLLRGEWFELTWRKEVLAKYKEEAVLLDASLLDEEVMKKIMLIADTKTDTRITYIEGPKGVEGVSKKVQKDENQVGFCLYPVEMKDFIAVSDAGEIMPPKSTWFEPRIKNGLLVFEF